MALGAIDAEVVIRGEVRKEEGGRKRQKTTYRVDTEASNTAKVAQNLIAAIKALSCLIVEKEARKQKIKMS